MKIFNISGGASSLLVDEGRCLDNVSISCNESNYLGIYDVIEEDI